MKTYLRHRIVNVIDVKELIALEYLDFDGKYKDYSEAHGFWELCYVESGEVVLHVNGQTLDIREGEIALVTRDADHSYRKKTDSARVFVICFESPSQLLYPLARGAFETDGIQKSCISSIIRDAMRTFRMNEKEQLEVLPSASFGGEQLILTQLEYLLIYTLGKISEKEGTKIVFLDSKDFYSEIVDVIIKYLNDNIDRSLTLEQICARVNYSSSFLCRTFKNQTGLTVFQYFNKIKVERAKQLISETNRPILQIALELGFTNTKYFNTLFKKLTGKTPSQYRKERLK